MPINLRQLFKTIKFCVCFFNEWVLESAYVILLLNLLYGPYCSRGICKYHCTENTAGAEQIVYVSCTFIHQMTPQWSNCRLTTAQTHWHGDILNLNVFLVKQIDFFTYFMRKRACILLIYLCLFTLRTRMTTP